MRQVYPAPTIVIGVGRFGLAALERLGDDWMGLEISGADSSIKNLRLVAVRPELASAPEPAVSGNGSGRVDGLDGWRRKEVSGAHVARRLGDGDLPSRALDLVVLRSLGLVRYRDGGYQLGVPRDDGPVEIEEQPAGRRRAVRHTSRRRRFFRWIDLSPDPIVAAEKLRQVTERDRSVDLFLTPMLQRIHRGLSPRTLLATIGRWIALGRGRDPSPWPWLRQALEVGRKREDEHSVRLTVTPELVDEVCCREEEPERQTELRRAVRRSEPFFHKRLEPPLIEEGESAAAWRRRPWRHSRWRQWLESAEGAPVLELSIPQGLVPKVGDLAAPLDPMEFLTRDWQAASWASDEGRPEDRTFLALETTSFRLGLFDHDGRRADPAVRAVYERRLKELSHHVHQGLLRLWVDLQRVRAADVEPAAQFLGRERASVAGSLQQSLELLGELVVRPVASPDIPPGEAEAPPAPRPGSRVERELPDRPSHFLSGLVVEERAEDDPIRRQLLSRLLELGLVEEQRLRRFRHHLLAEVVMTPDDLEDPDEPEPPEPRALAAAALPAEPEIAAEAVASASVEAELPAETVASGSAGTDEEAEPGEQVFGLQGLRRKLNQQVRQLFDFQLLAQYRDRPTRQPPRLSVFVVGDMSEPFARASLRPILREVHAELLRAFTPLFQGFREGFDRSLCVTPILWMPHPADPFKGASASSSRCEEAAIIDAVHGIRHWVECVLPPGRRFIPQIFINSRVTDTATLTVRDAVRETRDFLTLQMRSDLAADPWLRRISAGSGQSDLFASFSCFEIDFPALRCREYVANRLARELLDEVRGSDEPADKELELPDVQAAFGPPGIDDLVGKARKMVADETRAAAAKARGLVEERLVVHESTRTAELLQRASEEFGAEIEGLVQSHWSRLTGALGEVDEAVDELRVRIARAKPRGLLQRVAELRQVADRVIAEQIVDGGLTRALGALHRLRRQAGELFRDQEEVRRERERWARLHVIPEFAGVQAALREVREAAREKPDRDPLLLGYLFWGLLSLALGAPLANAVAYALDLHLRGGLGEALLGPLGYLTGGLFLFLPAWALLRWNLRRRTRRVHEAVGRLAARSAQLLEGTGVALAKEPPSSVRSFLESCLELAAAAASRGFALRILERAIADVHLGERLVRSVDVQNHRLSRRAEDLGVRTTLDGGTADEDLTHLLDGHGARRSERLIGGDSLHGYYRRHVRDRDHLRAHLEGFLAEAGGVELWRKQACLAQTDQILGYGREAFASLVEDLISDQPFFDAEVGRQLLRFVARCYSNIGFGAEFRGYEGLDPDGVQLVADATLVVHPELAPVYRRALEEEKERVRQARDGSDGPLRDEIRTTKTMPIQEASIRPNAAYMLSLVQGIRVHSVRNLRRFESFHDRVQMPDDRAFPLTPETRAGRGAPPVNSLSGFRDAARGWTDRRERPDDGPKRGRE